MLREDNALGLRRSLAESPAHAGMDRASRLSDRSTGREPRARGDGPRPLRRGHPSPKRAPRTRGWTVSPEARTSSTVESPAHAGMDRPCAASSALAFGEPRARGDGPSARSAWVSMAVRAPRTRGWTVTCNHSGCAPAESPAHAGMDRRAAMIRRTGPGEPRARGDGPTPAPLTCCRQGRAPRTRGWTITGMTIGLILRESPAHAGMDRTR